MNMIDEDSKSRMLDWGEFVISNRRYAINEGTEQELALALMRYSPHIKFKVHPVFSASHIGKNMKVLSQA